MNNSRITKLKFLLLAVVYFLSLPLSNIIYIFKPLYKKVYYGQSNPLFEYGGSVIFLVIFYILIRTVLIRKLGIKYNKEAGQLPLKNTLIIFFTTFIVIFLISALIGFNVKPFYDIGDNFTGFQLIIQAVKLLYYAVVVLFILGMIENFQYFSDDLLPIKKSISAYIPMGGLLTMLTYGIYASVMAIATPVWLYLLLILIFGEIYLVSKRSIIKTYASMCLIFIF